MQAVRAFSTRASCSLSGHYQTLDIPKNATRNQIKASFYKLSKKYHPDVNDDPNAKEKFQAVSEAYAILGDERKRRAYDRSLASESATSYAHPPHEAHPHWSYEGRRRGASHAWEYSRRPNTGPRYTYPPPPGSTHYAHHPHQRPPPPGTGPNPFSSPHVQRATGTRGPLPSGPSDSVARESMFMRTVTVVALVMLMATIGHGFSASAA
ncbi:DnaJ-domain-containing protein [Trametes cingulata]|nr:DnaJ-domain-containing protein [Trametes cingulata]